MECSRATGKGAGRRAEEEPGGQIPIPGTGLGYIAYLPAPLGRDPCTFPEEKGWGGFPFVQQVAGRCANRSSNIWIEKEKPLPDVPVTHVGVIWSQPWVTSLYVVSYLWTWPLWGGLIWAIDARDRATLQGTVGVQLREDPTWPPWFVVRMLQAFRLEHREVRVLSPSWPLESCLGCPKLVSENKEGGGDSSGPFGREIPGLSLAVFLIWVGEANTCCGADIRNGLPLACELFFSLLFCICFVLFYFFEMRSCYEAQGGLELTPQSCVYRCALPHPVHKCVCAPHPLTHARES